MYHEKWALYCVKKWRKTKREFSKKKMLSDLHDLMGKESSPSVGQYGVNLLHKKLCSSRFTVDCAIYDLLHQTDVLLHKKLLNNQRG